MSDQAIFDGLNEQQIEAVRHTEGPLLVVAGAGSGKTRVITRRIAYMIAHGIPAQQIVAITFTNKAANEMLSRVHQLLDTMDAGPRPTLATFHAYCTLLPRIYGRLIGVDPNFTIFDEADRTKLVKAAAEGSALPVGLTAAKVADRISYAKSHRIGPDHLDRYTRLPEYQRPAVASIYRRYEQLLKDNRGLDFDDLLLRALDLLELPEGAEAVRRRYLYLLIDEYQDTNRIQYYLAKALAGPQRNICATGDPDQSIYGWRGADIRNILDFQTDYPDAKVVYLEKNYRSTACILRAADSLIRCNVQRKEKTLVPVLGDGEPVELHAEDDEEHEAQRVVDIIEAAKGRGVPLGEMAVFCRVNSLLRDVEQALRWADIPYELARGTGFFQKREIKDVLAYLRVLVNPDDQLSLERIINAPTRGIGQLAQSALKAFAQANEISLFEAVRRSAEISALGKSQANVAAFGAMIESLRAQRDTLGLHEFVSRVINVTGLRAYYERQGEKANRSDELSPAANLDEFRSSAGAFAAGDAAPGKGAAPADAAVSGGNAALLQEFISHVSLMSDVDTVKEGQDRVTLLTMHAAKGLEFTLVIIIAAEEEIVPHVLALEDGIEEERRLFFVALTRAKRFLHVCYTHRRATRGSSRRCMPSRFLRELDPRVVRGMTLGATERPARNFQFVINPRRQDPQAEPAAPPPCRFHSGQRIYHEKFGYGVIEEIYLSGTRYTAGIRFHSAGVKKIVLEQAPIHPVREQ